MRKAVTEIRDGTFAKRWRNEQAVGSPVYPKVAGRRLGVAHSEGGG